MHVDALGSRVEENQIFLHFADAADGAFEHALDEDALLGVHDLIVASFQLAVDIDVLDVQTPQVLEDFIIGPSFNVLNTTRVSDKQPKWFEY